MLLCTEIPPFAVARVANVGRSAGENIDSVMDWIERTNPCYRSSEPILAAASLGSNSIHAFIHQDAVSYFCTIVTCRTVLIMMYCEDCARRSTGNWTLYPHPISHFTHMKARSAGHGHCAYAAGLAGAWQGLCELLTRVWSAKWNTRVCDHASPFTAGLPDRLDGAYKCTLRLLRSPPLCHCQLITALTVYTVLGASLLFIRYYGPWYTSIPKPPFTVIRDALVVRVRLQGCQPQPQ